MEGSVKVITDEVFRLHLSGTHSRYVVPIDHDIHERRREAAHDDVIEAKHERE